MKKILLALAVFVSTNTFAKEGMWIPSLIQSINEGDMKTMGMKISAEQLYAFNKSSLKDAVVHFGGGCTSELISSEGLLLTNHHCGYGRIQAHSSMENNYLKNGFWAMKREEEKSNPGLTATIIVRMEEVTGKILEGTTDGMSQAEKKKIIAGNIAKVGGEATKDSHYGYIIRPFYYGNQYFLFITETFKDVRLVGAPPSSIGKFGFDTDNWVLPRHTGDFSIFRIYAGTDNKPADYAESNVPYKPKHFFPINLGAEKPGDFTMVYGFPGYTQEYLTSHAVEYLMERQDPARIAIRDISLGIINEAMQADEATNIKYASKQSRISNAWKKWKGELKGLRRLDAIEKKRAVERKFEEAISGNDKYLKYAELIPTFARTYQEIEPFQFSRDYFIEIFYYGPEVIRFADGFNKLLKMLESDETKEEDLQKEIERLKKRNEGFFKNYDASIDRKLLSAMLEQYIEELDPSLAPDIVEHINDTYGGSFENYSKGFFAKSLFVDKEKIDQWLEKPMAKKLRKDPALKLSKSLADNYFSKVKPSHSILSNKLDSLYTIYMAALMEVLPEDRVYFPDANSTLRISYGQVEGYNASDAVDYGYYTTLEGIMQKYVPDNYEFDVPAKLRELYEKKDYGDYANDGEMRVCFIASNHTTGGNSGSPALDAYGNLIGLNFDRVWEGTMSDIMFDPDKCRNIMVDLNYVLFIIDKFAGAEHLVKEMKVLKN